MVQPVKIKNIFTSLGSAVAGIFTGTAANIRVALEWQIILIVFIYMCINIALFLQNGIQWMQAMQAQNLPPAWIFLARAFAQVLNFNCALILFPVMRSILTIIRNFNGGLVLPLDKNITFHRYIAYMIAVAGFGHGLAHYFNYSCCAFEYFSLTPGPNPGDYVKDPNQNWWLASYGTKAGITGNLLILTMVIMYAAANKSYRRSKNFSVFWATHHLFIVFYVLLLVHAPRFWPWFFGPAVLYLLERILRLFRGNALTVVRKVHALPSRVIHLELEKPGFFYRAGQYCFINVPLISRTEWHPFTISSAPEEDTLQFHIRCVGDWTNELMNLFNPSKKDTVEINQPKTPDGRDCLIRVDGPFGTCAEFVFDFKYVMLVCAGIGVTPYSSLLKHIYHRRVADKNMKLKKVYFYWINRDTGSWEWFSDVLAEIEGKDPEFFSINTFMTGELTADQAKQAFFGSMEYQQRSPDSGGQEDNRKNKETKARALYDYEPQAQDEIALRENDIIVITEKDASGWWKGTNQSTKQTGLFPYNMVLELDGITKLKQSLNRKYGRPVWRDEFERVKNETAARYTPEQLKAKKKRPRVGVFLCGPAALAHELRTNAYRSTRGAPVRFVFHKENF